MLNDSFTEKLKNLGHTFNNTLNAMTERERELLLRRMAFEMFVKPAMEINKREDL